MSCTGELKKKEIHMINPFLLWTDRKSEKLLKSNQECALTGPNTVSKNCQLSECVVMSLRTSVCICMVMESYLFSMNTCCLTANSNHLEILLVECENKYRSVLYFH